MSFEVGLLFKRLFKVSPACYMIMLHEIQSNRWITEAQFFLYLVKKHLFSLILQIWLLLSLLDTFSLFWSHTFMLSLIKTAVVSNVIHLKSQKMTKLRYPQGVDQRSAVKQLSRVAYNTVFQTFLLFLDEKSPKNK